MMLGLILAAATIGQVNCGDYYGLGYMAVVQGEPYYEVEGEFEEPEDSGSYPVYDFTDGGDPGPALGAAFGAGGVAVLVISEPSAENYVVVLSLYPNPATTGRIVTVSGTITVILHDSDANPQLEYRLPVFAVFLNPRTMWTYTSGIFNGMLPGSFLTARFEGGGFGSNFTIWGCPGVRDTMVIQ